LPAPTPAALAASTRRRSEAATSPFEIVVGLQALIDHGPLEGIFVDRDDRPARRLTARRIPRRPARNQQDQIGILQEGLGAGAEMQRMVLREVRKNRAPADGNAKKLGEFDQRRERCRIAAGSLGQNHRVAGGDQQIGDLP
jgi:hypothetical protein